MSQEDFQNATDEKMKMLYSKMSEKEQNNSREQVIYMCRGLISKLSDKNIKEGKVIRVIS